MNDVRVRERMRVSLVLMALVITVLDNATSTIRKMVALNFRFETSAIVFVEGLVLLIHRRIIDLSFVCTRKNGTSG